MYVTEENKEPASPDVKKENLLNIMEVIDQLNADIKYSVDHENNLRTNINELRNTVKLKEDKIIQLSDERQALINAREGIFKAMNYLDPPEHVMAKLSEEEPKHHYESGDDIAPVRRPIMYPEDHQTGMARNERH